MKIASSQVSMASSHEAESHFSAKSALLEAKAEGGAKAMRAAAIYEGSGSSMGSHQEARAEVQEKRAQVVGTAQQAAISVQQTQSQAGVTSWKELYEDVKKRLLDKMIELLNGVKDVHELKRGELSHGKMLDLRGPESRGADMRYHLFGKGAFSAEGSGQAGTTAGGTLWQRITAASGTRAESEHTTFQSRGFAVTEDGRSLSFDVELDMSRSFTQKFEALTAESFIMTDPLIINMDSNVTSVSDVKFRFDLDSDGQEEDISFAGEGSGFLALDANGNGRIDDGSELFGTKSGDGFADLAAYDGDDNHWIDENDAVYSKLRVWTKDAEGNDRLMGLKEANVGAIYLGSISTEFSLKDAETNETNAVIRKTGVYLKESGEVGTLSDVDLRS